MPVVAVATSAPAFAASPVCTPILTVDEASSCKCPGQSTGGQEYAYYLKFCVTDNSNCPSCIGSTFRIINVAKMNPGLFVSAPDACYPGTLAGTAGSTVGGCTSEVLRFKSSNSANFLVVTFEVTCPDGTKTTYTVDKIPAPPDCKDIGEAKRCEACV